MDNRYIVITHSQKYFSLEAVESLGYDIKKEEISIQSELSVAPMEE